MTKAAVLFSGGLDSTAALTWTIYSGYEPVPIFFNYGQKNLIAETEAVNKICNRIGLTPIVLSMPVLSEIGGSSLTSDKEVKEHTHGKVNDTFVPGRNMMFLVSVAAYASVNNIKSIITGIRESNDFPDCRKTTLDMIGSSIDTGISPMNIVHPIFNVSRKDTFLMIRNSAYADLIDMTISCYNGTNCGICKPCQDRKKALEEL